MFLVFVLLSVYASSGGFLVLLEMPSLMGEERKRTRISFRA
jgi:hypothetical protein